MSHCAPAARKPVRFKFMPETRVGNVLVTYVCWEAVPDTWPDNSKTPVTECVVCAWNSTQSVVDERSWRQGPSETKCMSSSRYEGAWSDNDEKTACVTDCSMYIVC